MDTRILTLGKYDINKPSIDRSLSMIRSDCYFDWIELRKMDTETEKSASDMLLLYGLTQKKLQAEEPDTRLNEKHLQESLLLISDEDNDDFLLDASFLYVSMINIPMWEESVFSDARLYAEKRAEVYTRINQEINSLDCRLYYTIDHCDMILVADGCKISLREYYSILNRIRAITLREGNNSIVAVLDITTIYGYTEQFLMKEDLPDQSFSAVLEMSFKNLQNRNQLLQTLQPSCDFLTETFGRYDSMAIWKNIKLCDFNKFIRSIHNHEKEFFAYRIIIGGDSSYESNYEYGSHEFSASKLRVVSNKEFLRLYDDLKKRGLKEVLLKALIEIQNSISAMLKNGFAQYYLLSFYESFYCFMCYIQRLLIKANENTVQQNAYFEIIDDVFRDYFRYLNALNACTVHSERQFLQTDSYQLLYFDAFPKLVAFYTAVANRITSVVEKDTGNDYTFLITPDFKEDIFVDTITEDRTVGEERNILVIHMDEKSMCNISSAIKTVIHEMYHHIGQSRDMRKNRAALFRKCCVAYILANNIPFGLVAYESEQGKEYELFEKMVDCFCERFFEIGTLDYHRDLLDLSQEKYDEEQEKHYIEYQTISFIKYMSATFAPDKSGFFSGVFDECFSKPLEQYIDFIEQPCSGKEADIIRQYSNGNLHIDLYTRIYNWLSQNNSIDTYGDIAYAFRESFADICMLKLTSEVASRSKVYTDMIHDFKGETSNNEKPRIISVLKCLSNEHKWIAEYKKSTFDDRQNNSLDINPEHTLDMNTEGCGGLFYWYLSEQIKKYLLTIEQKETNSSMDKLTNSIRSIFNTLENGNCKEIIKMMDEEIYAYRQRLIKRRYI